MESTGVTNRIQISLETMNLLMASGKNEWVQPRETTITAKGKGELQTFWLLSPHEQAALSVEENSTGEESYEQYAVSIESV